MKLKENKGMSLIVLTIILAVLIVVAGGVIVYLLNNPVKEGTTIQTPTNVGNLNSSDEVTVKLSNAEEVKQMTADERFALYAKGLKNSLSKFYEFGEVFDEEKYQCKVPVDFDVADERIEDINIEYNGDLYLNFKSNSDLAKKYGVSYKLTSNIIKAGAMQMGQAVSTFIYAINDSGDFLYCEVEQSSNNNLKLKVINKLKNIVEIQRFSNGETYNLLVAIDIDGKMYDIKNYI